MRAVCLAIAIAACDDAVDGGYVGETLHLIEGTIAAGQADLPRPVRIAVVWGAGASTLAAPVEGSFPARYTLRVVAVPPAAVMRSASVGRFAVGQVVLFVDADGSGTFDPTDPTLGTARTLVLFTPDGASDPALVGDFTPGFHRVDASAPCAHDAVRFAPRPTEPLDIAASTDPSPELFTSAGCAARVIATNRACQSLWQTRFVCRVAAPDEALCAECERYLFPEGQPELCDAWHAHCLTAWSARFAPAQCDDERRNCHDGEPARAQPCDLACACERFDEACRETTDAPACLAKNADCDWR